MKYSDVFAICDPGIPAIGIYVPPPVLKPNHPKNKIAAPIATNGTECGFVDSFLRIARFLITVTAPIAAAPQVT